MIRNKNTWQMRNKKEKQNTKHPQVDIVSGRHASQWPIYTFVVWFIGSFAFFFLFLFRHTHTLRNHDDWIRETYVIYIQTCIRCVHLLRYHWSLSWSLVLLSLFTSYACFIFPSWILSIWLALRMLCFRCVFVFRLFFHIYYGYWFVYIFVLVSRFIRIARCILEIFGSFATPI